MDWDLIQQYLDENERLISAIIDELRQGKLEDSARNQERLQQNLDRVAALTKKQSRRRPTPAQQARLYPANAPVEPVPRLNSRRPLQTQQGQPMNSTTSMVAQPATLHDQMHTEYQLQQQEMQQAASNGGTSEAYSMVDGSSRLDRILPGALSSTEGQGSILMPDYPTDSEQQGENWDFLNCEILDLPSLDDDESSF